MKLTLAATFASFGLLASAAPGTTAAPAAYGGGKGGGKGGGGGGGGGSTCYPYTYFWTSSGYAEYPSTIYKTESAPFTKTLTSYKTIVTDVPSSYVTTIVTKIPKTSVQEFFSTSTGYKLATKAETTKIKSSWTSVGSKVTSTCKAGGGGGGSGGYGSGGY